MSHPAAEALFARLIAWLETKGVSRGPNATELELGRLARLKVGRDEPLRFITEFYLPAKYGHGPRITAEEAARLVDLLSPPLRRDDRTDAVVDRAPRGAPADAHAGEPEDAPADEPPAPAEERRCLSCGDALA